MKHKAFRYRLLAAVLAALLLFAGCGRTGSAARSGNASAPAENMSGGADTDSDSVQEGEAEPAGEDAEEGTAGAEKTAEPVRMIADLEHGPSLFGSRMVSMYDCLIFATNPGVEENVLGSADDGLYMTDFSIDQPVRLAQGRCGPVWCDGSAIYFYNRTALKSGFCRMDMDAAEMEWIRTDNAARPVENLFVWGEELVFLRDGVLVFQELTGTDTWTETKFTPDGGEITLAKPSGDGIFYSVFDPETGARKIGLFDRENMTVKQVAEPDTYGFTPFYVNDHYEVYYFKALPDQPVYEDWRQYEFEILRADQDGTVTPEGVTGRFGDTLYVWGDYLIYTKYQEVQEWGGSDIVLTVSRPYCYNTRTKEEYAIVRDSYIGWDVRIADAGGGFLYLDIYDVRTDEWGEYMYSQCDDLSQDVPGTILFRDKLAESAELSEAFVKEQQAAEEEAKISEEERRAAEEERKRQEEEAARNEPYGPGTSKLYLKAGDLSACFRLVRMDGSTEFQVLLSPGESTTMSFPCGRYTLKIARGETWISDEEAFGPKGKYSSTNVFTFESGASYEISTGTRGDFHGDSQQGFTS
ncbi:MAG: hypothetical protein IIY46_04935 [Lachnospiraceae bacterium]|nr:hypothetical protein [Lachnospiraceae bacterium]